MWLSVAIWRDICFHIVQANKYTAFIENTGKGPHFFKEERKRKGLKETSYLHAKKNWQMTLIWNVN